MTTPKRAGRSQKPVTKKPTKTPANAPQKAKGRPLGAKTRDYPAGVSTITRCIVQACLSTEKRAVGSPVIVDANTIAPDGKPANQVVNRRVVCRTCGQHRIDKEYRYVQNDKHGKYCEK